MIKRLCFPFFAFALLISAFATSQSVNATEPISCNRKDCHFVESQSPWLPDYYICIGSNRHCVMGKWQMTCDDYAC